MILNFGSLNIDHVYRVPHIVKPGETLSSSHYERHFGGKGFNQSIALARSGMKLSHAGAIGKDGEVLLSQLAAEGVDIEHIFTMDGPTGTALIQVDSEGQNSILLYPGANYMLSEEQIDVILDQFPAQTIILLQNELQKTKYLMDAALKRGFRIILNPSPWDSSLGLLDFSSVEWLFVNEIEGEYLTGEKEAGKILEICRKKFPQTQIVLTCGEEGSYCLAKGEIYFCPAFRTEAVDTTAAGDTFQGYFLEASINENRNPGEALKRASAAAALAVSKAGAFDSIPVRTEVDRFLKEIGMKQEKRNGN